MSFVTWMLCQPGRFGASVTMPSFGLAGPGAEMPTPSVSASATFARDAASRIEPAMRALTAAGASGGRDGVGEPAGAPHDGHGAVAHRDHLPQAARLVARWHEKEIARAVDELP